jgi:hypothetical protein
MLKWKRKVRLTLAGAGGGAMIEGSQAPDDGFKIDFKVTKTLGSKQNSGTVTIWNASKSNRSKMGEEFTQLKLEVGYEDGGMSVLIAADIRDVSHDKSSPDISSEISFGDGDKGVNKGAVSKTFPAGTKPKAVFDHLVGEMPELEMGKVQGLDDLPPYKRPVTVYGWASRELDTLGRENKFYWNIDKNKVNAVKNDEHLGQCAVISKETGMIGVPEETDKGIKVKALIEVSVVPGYMIKVESNFLDLGSGRDKKTSDAGGGEFRVNAVTFSGSTREEAFFMEIEANRVQGGKVVK